MFAIKKDSKWLDNIGHICTVLNVPEDQEDLTKMIQYQYQVEYQLTVRPILPPVHENMADYDHLLWKHHRT
jgi:hypothetical protein